MSLGLLLAALALDTFSKKQADKKRKRTIDTHERKNIENTDRLIENSTDTALKTFGQGRMDRYDKNAADLESGINDLVTSQTEPYDGSSGLADPTGTEQAKRSVARKQQSIDMAKLLSRYGGQGGNRMQEGLMLSKGADTARGIGSDMQDDYSQFTQDYNGINENPALGAMSSIMKMYALGGMFGG